MTYTGTIQYKDEDTPITVTFCDNSDNDDIDIFWYVNGAHNLQEMVDDGCYGTDGWKLISFEADYEEDDEEEPENDGTCPNCSGEGKVNDFQCGQCKGKGFIYN